MSEQWRDELRELLAGRSGPPPKSNLAEGRRRVAKWISKTVAPTFKELRGELQKHGRSAVIERGDYYAAIRVFNGEREEFSYSIRGRIYHKLSFAMPRSGKEEGQPVLRAEVMLKDVRKEGAKVKEMTREMILRDFLGEYADWLEGGSH
ncbi:MAG: hypothetical protein CSB49_08215 [Proteobacteria bacterium]|nr:MAG: hypothetical protein CSB49_08215 [Pseudomonadota bacterium]